MCVTSRPVDRAQPLVSVIIPTFNRQRLVSVAIESVLNQSFQDFEIIVVDDGSTDDTAAAVQSFRSEKIRYIFQVNKGRSSARNHALSVARGSYITFLDSDDTYLPEKLLLEVRFLDEHPEVGMVYTSAYCVDEAGTLLRSSYKATVSGWIYKDIAFFKPVTVTLPTVMVRRKVFDAVGGFDGRMERFEDTDMWRRISKRYSIGAIREPTCKLLTHAGNVLAGQDPQKIESSVSFYVNKIFSEDGSFGRSLLRNGAARLYFFYAKALLTTTASVSVGRRMLFKSLRYQPMAAYRLAFLGYYLLVRLRMKWRQTGRTA